MPHTSQLLTNSPHYMGTNCALQNSELSLTPTPEFDTLTKKKLISGRNWKDLNQIIYPFSGKRGVSGLPQPMF